MRIRRHRSGLSSPIGLLVCLRRLLPPLLLWLCQEWLRLVQKWELGLNLAETPGDLILGATETLMGLPKAHLCRRSSNNHMEMHLNKGSTTLRIT